MQYHGWFTHQYLMQYHGWSSKCDVRNIQSILSVTDVTCLCVVCFTLILLKTCVAHRWRRKDVLRRHNHNTHSASKNVDINHSIQHNRHTSALAYRVQKLIHLHLFTNVFHEDFPSTVRRMYYSSELCVY